MNGWLVAGIVLLALFFLTLIRVGVELSFDESGLLVRIRLGALRLTVYPPKPKKKGKKGKKGKKKRPAEPPKPAQQEKPEPRGNTWPLIKAFLSVAGEAAGRLKRKIRVDHLDLDVTVGAGDPAAAAMAYGGVNAFLGITIPILEQNSNIKERSIRTRCDFDRRSPVAEVRSAFSLTIGQGVALGTWLGLRALGILLGKRKDEGKEAA